MTSLAGEVLVVDDEAVVREVVSRVLRSEGYDVVTVTTAAAALDSPAARTCGLVLCDLMLPDRSGLDVVRALRARRPELPVVLITGYASGASLAQAEEAGAAGFLPKPFDSEELLDAVRRAIREPAVVVKEVTP